MQASVKIKICGLTREVDVDAALELGADFFGFIVYPKSPRAIDVERAAQLAARVPTGRCVLVDVETRADDLRRYADYGFDYYQIHAGLPALADHLSVWSTTVGAECLWVAPRLQPTDAFPEAILAAAQTVVVDTYAPNQIGGTGRVGDWQQFADWRQRYPDLQFVLAGGLAPDNIVQAVQATGADHVDVNSGVERQPGVKDPQQLRDLFRALKA